MVKQVCVCVCVYNCENTNKTGHDFLKEGLRRQWVHFVSMKWANFKLPTRNSQAVDCRAKPIFAAMLQHRSLVGGRIVRRVPEVEKNFVVWQCPKSTALVSHCGWPTEKMQLQPSLFSHPLTTSTVWCVRQLSNV